MDIRMIVKSLTADFSPVTINTKERFNIHGTNVICYDFILPRAYASYIYNSISLYVGIGHFQLLD